MSAGEAKMLAECRERLRAVSPGDWRASEDADGFVLETMTASKMLLPVLRFDPGATPAEREFVVQAPAMVRFLLGLVDRAIEKARLASRAEGAPTGRPSDVARLGSGPSAAVDKDYAAEAAMKCAEPAFLKFLEDAHGLERPLTDQRAAQKLRSLLGVSSRRELNESAAAAARWAALRQQFDAWRRADR